MDRTAGRKGLRQRYYTLCSPGPLITKVNQAFPLSANRWKQLTLQFFLGSTTITHSKYSWNMHLLSYLLPGSPLNFTLPAQNSTAAINCRSGKIFTVSFSSNLKRFHFHLLWVQFCDQQKHFSAS